MENLQYKCTTGQNNHSILSSGTYRSVKTMELTGYGCSVYRRCGLTFGDWAMHSESKDILKETDRRYNIDRKDNAISMRWLNFQAHFNIT